MHRTWLKVDKRCGGACCAILATSILAVAAAFVSANAVAAVPPVSPPEESAPWVKPAIDGVLDLFKQRSVVALGDAHGLAQEEIFYSALVRDPRFADEVGNVVVEFGGETSQDIIDRYLRRAALVEELYARVLPDGCFLSANRDVQAAGCSCSCAIGCAFGAGAGGRRSWRARRRSCGAAAAPRSQIKSHAALRVLVDRPLHVDLSDRHRALAAIRDHIVHCAA